MLDNRMAVMNGLDGGTLYQLQQMMHDYNPYVNIFKQTYERMNQQPTNDIRMVIRADTDVDRRRYNIPTASEVAAIIPGDGSNDQETLRDIVLFKFGREIHRINQLNSAYDLYITFFFFHAVNKVGQQIYHFAKDQATYGHG